MSPAAALALAYLLGCLPSAYLAGRLHGIDLRRHGSGNLGATNVFRVLGWRAALPVLAADVGKGWAAAALLPRWDGAPDPAWAIAYGAAAVLGHISPVFLRFRGGKGVATAAGAFLALAPAAVLVAAGVWAAVVLATRIVAVGSVAAALALPLAVWILGPPGAVRWLATGVAALILYTHRSNLRRVWRGEERRIGRRAEGR